jgi:6-phosphofructokinase 1
MSHSISNLLVITSGGDAPGMNAAIRAVVRIACFHNINVYGCRGGYQGLIDEAIEPMGPESVANCIQRGGTISKTGRCEAFKSPEVRAKCIEFLKAKKIDAMVVIGGDGSFRGASLLYKEGGPQVIGIPATIDNDIAGTEYAIGFDTASNTALQAIDKIRDTASSHDRHFLVEVMGRHAGFLAVDVGIAGGAAFILTPEFPFDVKTLAETLNSEHRQKQSTIIVVAEADSVPGRSIKIADELKQRSDLDFKVCILGHTQRGGAPSLIDRKMASEMGALAVEALIKGKTNQMVALKNTALLTTEFPDPNNPGRRLSNDDLIKLNAMLAT